MRSKALGALSIALGLAAIVHSTSFTSRVAASIAHSRGCVAGLISGPAQSAKILILGSSRARQAINPDVLADAWQLPRQAVVNAAHPGRQMWVDFALLKQASQSGMLHLAIIELQAKSTDAQRREETIRNLVGRSRGKRIRLAGGAAARAAATILEYADAHALADSHSLGFVLSTYDWLRIEALRLQMGLKALLERKAFYRTYVWDEKIDPRRHNICGLKRLDADEHLHARPIHRSQMDAFKAAFMDLYPQGWEKAPEPDNDYFVSEQTKLERQALERIVELARRRKFEVVFTYLPSYFTLSPGPAFQLRFRHKTGEELVSPSRSLQRRLRPHYYHPTHLNSFGGRIYSRWLAQQITQRIPKFDRLARDNKF
jgi:hypothetical protein